jgi:glycosyltransferase involved in cell wall biosynthesis
MKYTIIIVCYKRYNHIKVILNSLLVQTYRNFECIIIHDGIDKKHEEIVGPYLNDSRFKYIQTDVRYNDCGMTLRNIGIQNATGDFILNTNDDNYYVPVFLEEVNLNVLRNPTCNFIYYDMVLSTDHEANHNNSTYGMLNTRLQVRYIDMGQFLVKSDLLKQYKFESRFDADGVIVEKMLEHITPVFINKILFVHN